MSRNPLGGHIILCGALQEFVGLGVGTKHPCLEGEMDATCGPMGFQMAAWGSPQVREGGLHAAFSGVWLGWLQVCSVLRSGGWESLVDRPGFSLGHGSDPVEGDAN